MRFVRGSSKWSVLKELINWLITRNWIIRARSFYHSLSEVAIPFIYRNNNDYICTKSTEWSYVE